MKIVIDIPDEVYYAIIEHGMIGVCACKHSLANAIKEGIRLPKGHGRLIDADELIKDRVENDNVVIVAKCAPTIIEADTESEVEE